MAVLGEIRPWWLTAVLGVSASSGGKCRHCREITLLRAWGAAVSLHRGVHEASLGRWHLHGLDEWREHVRRRVLWKFVLTGKLAMARVGEREPMYSLMSVKHC